MAPTAGKSLLEDLHVLVVAAVEVFHPSDLKDNREYGHGKGNVKPLSTLLKDTEDEDTIEAIMTMPKRVEQQGKFDLSKVAAVQGQSRVKKNKKLDGQPKQRATISKEIAGERGVDPCMNCIRSALANTANAGGLLLRRQSEPWQEMLCLQQERTRVSSSQGKDPLLLRRVARHLVEEALVLQKNLVEKQTKENDE
ncbi:hypothetical protein PG988_012951 [Apiospora saccharicola]